MRNAVTTLISAIVLALVAACTSSGNGSNPAADAAAGSGGTSGSGGVSTGGSAVGGNGTGGRSSGGSSTGGTATGGTATGGAATGGAATGGAATGGAATGGAATGGAATGGAATGGTSGAGSRPFDWVGVIGTGQSLSVGWFSTAISKTQPFKNLRLIDKGPDPKYPLSGGTPQWAVIPLVEPIRDWVAGSGPGYDDYQYPNDIWDSNKVAVGETPHSGMANTLSQIWQTGGGQGDYVTAHSAVGWSGHCLRDIDKGTRSYSGALAETRAFKSLADAAGKNYGVSAIVLTHGECDGNNSTYGAGIYQMLQDYDTDLKAITGQTQDVVMFASQPSTMVSGYTGSSVQIWQAGVTHPGKIVCIGPKYQYAGDLHLPGPGYERLGEKNAEVFDQVVNKHVAWKPLQPNKVTRAGAVVTIDFDVPNPPLVWDDYIAAPHQTSHTGWAQGHGFEVVDSSGTEIAIASTAIQGTSVVLTLAQTPASGTQLTVGYALTADSGASRATGQLRDSDVFVGYQKQTVVVGVTNGSATISGPSGAFLAVAGGDRVTGSGLSTGVFVAKWIFDVQVQLSTPWSGATGKADLTFVHDHSNYCVQFAMPIP